MLFDSLQKAALAISIEKNIEGKIVSKSYMPKRNKRDDEARVKRNDQVAITLLGSDIQVFTHFKNRFVPNPVHKRRSTQPCNFGTQAWQGSDAVPHSDHSCRKRFGSPQ